MNTNIDPNSVIVRLLEEIRMKAFRVAVLEAQVEQLQTKIQELEAKIANLTNELNERQSQQVVNEHGTHGE